MALILKPSPHCLTKVEVVVVLVVVVVVVILANSILGRSLLCGFKLRFGNHIRSTS